jgi:Domain of unknown function (DUF4385)
MAGSEPSRASSKSNPYLQQKRRPKPVAKSKRDFDYSLDYKKLNFRKAPTKYRVGKGEQGVLMVEPYKSEILPFWKFKTPPEAEKSAKAIMKLFRKYKREGDFVGMDMTRKFIQMGYTRARRYANHKSGTKYAESGEMLKLDRDPVKAKSADIFYAYWKKLEADKTYAAAKAEWREQHG